jgi:hypothetical protein
MLAGAALAGKGDLPWAVWGRRTTSSSPDVERVET